MAAVLEIGNRVSVVSYGPFRGLKGTIRQSHVIADPEEDELFCFYYVELDVAQVREPVWFEGHEVEALIPSAFAGVQ
jgi:hypothetical protein